MPEEDNFYFLKNLLLVVLFFVFTPLTIGLSLFSLLSVKPEVDSYNNDYHTSGVRVYASLPSEYPSMDGSYSVSDARNELVRLYLDRYNSPLEPYSDFIVEIADKYGLDFRLITAIAQQESNLCKIIPEDTFNCWGWGIHSKGTLGFESFEEGIETVSAGLKKEYIDKGLVTPEEIMSKYTPLSNGSWAKGVTLFMEQMQ